MFAYFDLATQQRLLTALSPEEIAVVLNGMSPDDRTAGPAPGASSQGAWTAARRRPHALWVASR